jgi:hypothetical protein
MNRPLPYFACELQQKWRYRANQTCDIGQHESDKR